MQPKMKEDNIQDIIFLHGAWHGPWCWKALTNDFGPLYRCHTPTMPGRLGETAKVFRKLSLHDYIDAIENFLKTLDKPVYLIAHSLAGLVATHIASHYPEKIKGLIYVAAYIPQDGQSMFELCETLNQQHMTDNMQVDIKQNQVIFDPNQVNQYFYNKCPLSEERALSIPIFESLCPEPLKAFTTRVKITNNIKTVKKLYIQTTKDRILHPSCQHHLISQHQINHAVRLESDHSPFISAPRKLINMIEKWVSE